MMIILANGHGMLTGFIRPVAAMRGHSRIIMDWNGIRNSGLRTARIAQKPSVDVRKARPRMSNTIQKTHYCQECERLAKQVATEREIKKAEKKILLKEVAKNRRFREALEMITGKRRCLDHLMGNVDIAQWALESESVDE